MQEQQVQTQEVKKASKLHIASYILNVVLLIAVIVLTVMLVKPEGGFTSILGDKKVDMRERVGEPQTFWYDYDYKFYMNWEAENISGKTIKYCEIEVVGINSVEDIISSRTFKITGPIENGDIIKCDLKSGNIYGEWWDDMEGVKKVEITNITLEYMDGTKETGDYGYSTDVEEDEHRY